ncbi:MAG: pyridoxamine 5'-phosphate oxidase family protein [Pseudomonadota bacterium]
MAHAYHTIAFTEAVKALQEQRGSRASYARFEEGPDRGDRIGPDEAAFIAARDSFYMASTSVTGWPYVQHRGGPVGFVRVLDEKTLGFADFSGNRQYVSLGNIQSEDRVSLFFMDYANRARLKLFGHASVIDPAEEETLAKLAMPAYPGQVERGIAIKLTAFDWNCPQHITPRYSEAQVAQVVDTLTARVAELEARLAKAES